MSPGPVATPDALRNHVPWVCALRAHSSTGVTPGLTQVGLATDVPSSVMMPACCEPLMVPQARHEQVVKFDERHAVQQASIIGNMDRVGACGCQGCAHVPPGCGRETQRRLPRRSGCVGDCAGSGGACTQRARDSDDVAA